MVQQRQQGGPCGLFPTPPLDQGARCLRRSSMPECYSYNSLRKRIVLAGDGERTASLRNWNHPEVEKLLAPTTSSKVPA